MHACACFTAVQELNLDIAVANSSSLAVLSGVCTIPLLWDLYIHEYIYAGFANFVREQIDAFEVLTGLGLTRLRCLQG